MTTHSNILAWEIPEEPGGLQAMGSQRVRHDLATKQSSQLPDREESLYSWEKKQNKQWNKISNVIPQFPLFLHSFWPYGKKITRNAKEQENTVRISSPTDQLLELVDNDLKRTHTYQRI